MKVDEDILEEMLLVLKFMFGLSLIESNYF
jgi:hypothetical protein